MGICSLTAAPRRHVLAWVWHQHLPKEETESHHKNAAMYRLLAACRFLLEDIICG